MAAPTPARVDWVDAAKGVCILLVVMMHSTLGVEAAVGVTGWMGLAVEFARPFRMPDFFLISGLFLARTLDRDWRTFADRRILHFLYFYLLWVTVQFAFKAPAFAAEAGAAETLRAYLLALTIEPFGTLWFIWILPVFAVVVRLTRRVPVPVMLALAAGLEIAPVATGWLAIDEFAARFVYFYAGYALAPWIFRLASAAAARPGMAILGLAAWAVVNGAVLWSGHADRPFVSLTLGALGAMAVVTVAVLIDRTARGGALARFVGSRSLVVYLGFFLPMAAAREVLVAAEIVPDVGTLSLIVTAAAVSVPFVMHRTALGVGARFLYERPRWARLDRRANHRSVLQPAE